MRIWIACALWLLADLLELLRDSVEITREVLLRSAGKVAGL